MINLLKHTGQKSRVPWLRSTQAARPLVHYWSFFFGFFGFRERLLALHNGQIGAFLWICWWHDKHDFMGGGCCLGMKGDRSYTSFLTEFCIYNAKQRVKWTKNHLKFTLKSDLKVGWPILIACDWGRRPAEDSSGLLVGVETCWMGAERIGFTGVGARNWFWAEGDIFLPPPSFPVIVCDVRGGRAKLDDEWFNFPV